MKDPTPAELPNLVTAARAGSDHPSVLRENLQSLHKIPGNGTGEILMLPHQSIGPRHPATAGIQPADFKIFNQGEYTFEIRLVSQGFGMTMPVDGDHSFKATDGCLDLLPEEVLKEDTPVGDFPGPLDLELAILIDKG